jgi:serine protease inhibitor
MGATKMKNIFTVLLLSLLFSCSRDFSSLQENGKPAMRALKPSETQLVKTSRNFGIKLFEKINSQDASGDNLFISPLSVSMALGMTMNGAAGETYEAMRQTLDFGDLSEDEINEAYRSLIDLLLHLDPEVVFEIANSIWPRQGFPVLPSFLEANQTYFDSEVRPLDFVRPDAVMYLINAIYFKGTWTYRFDEQLTAPDIFYTSGQGSVQCQMMKISGNWLYHWNDDVEIIDLPYGDSLFTMTVFLPETDRNIDDFIAGLTPEKYKSYLNSLEYHFGTLEMPKLKIGYKLLLNDALQALGMGIAFGGGADFSRISSGGGICISQVIHQTFLQVDEEGTEAAAATIVGLKETNAGGPSGFFMKVNRPYFFVIRERVNNTILFMGKIMEPEWEES